MQRFVDDGIASGVGSRSAGDLFAAATARVDSSRNVPKQRGHKTLVGG